MKIRLLDYGGRCPERAHANDAGADVFSPRDAVIRPGEICKIPLGFGLLVPDGYAGFVFPLSLIHISEPTRHTWISFCGFWL